MAEQPPENVRFIHAADLHLGRPFDALGPKAEERRADLRATFHRIVERALQERVDLFLVAGDLFDSPGPPPADREAARSGFRRLTEAGIPCFAIPGNHDYYIPGGVWSEMETAGVTVFSSPRLAHTDLPDLGLKIFGMAYDRSRPQARPLANLEVQGAAPNGRSLLLFHGSLDVADIFNEGYRDAPFSEEEIARLPFAYVALGHYHGFREIGRGVAGRNPLGKNPVGKNPLGENPLGKNPVAAYPGSPEGLVLNPREAGERIILLGRLETRGDETSVHLQPIPVNQRRIVVADLDLSHFSGPDDFFEAVRASATPDDLLSLRLTGIASSDIWEALDELEDRFGGAFFFFRADPSRVAVPGEIPDDDRFILGRFCNKLLAAVRSAEGEDKKVLEIALRLGLTTAGSLKPSSQVAPSSVS